MRTQEHPEPAAGAIGRRGLLAAAAAFALGGCAVQPPRGAPSGEAVAAPQWRVGDRWRYRRTDYYTRLDAGEVTCEVLAAEAGGLRVALRDASGATLDEASLTRAGGVSSGNLSADSPFVGGTLAPPFERYAFPLVSGKRWTQKLTRTRANGERYAVSARTRVEGWESVRAAGREVRAILIRRELDLGPKDHFNGRLYHYELEWYAPELRGAARLEVGEWFHEGGDDVLAALRPWTRLDCELLSFAPGG